MEQEYKRGTVKQFIESATGYGLTWRDREARATGTLNMETGIFVNREQSRLNQHFKKGDTHTQESKDAIALARTGTKHSEATKARIKQSNLGQTCSDETKAKISAARQGTPYERRNQGEDGRETRSVLGREACRTTIRRKSHANLDTGLFETAPAPSSTNNANGIVNSVASGYIIERPSQPGKSNVYYVRLSGDEHAELSVAVRALDVLRTSKDDPVTYISVNLILDKNSGIWGSKLRSPFQRSEVRL